MSILVIGLVIFAIYFLGCCVTVFLKIQNGDNPEYFDGEDTFQIIFSWFSACIVLTILIGKRLYNKRRGK